MDKESTRDDIKETVYEHISGNKTFTITVAENWSISMIKQLSRDRPDEVKIVAENKDGSIVAHIPLSWMRIVPKKQMEYTDEQKAVMRQRGIELRKRQLGA